MEGAVARGAGLLDHAIPGWTERIDVEVLNMRDMSTCVLGQLGGGWAENTMCILFSVEPLAWWRPDPLEDGWDDNYAIIGISADRFTLRRWAVDHGFDLNPDFAGHA